MNPFLFAMSISQRTRFVYLLLSAVWLATASAQDQWVYQPERTLRVTEQDSLAQLYQIEAGTDGSLWVLSSSFGLGDSSRVHNALYRAAYDTMAFALVDDYDDASMWTSFRLNQPVPTGLGISGGSARVSLHVKRSSGSTSPAIALYGYGCEFCTSEGCYSCSGNRRTDVFYAGTGYTSTFTDVAGVVRGAWDHLILFRQDGMTLTAFDMTTESHHGPANHFVGNADGTQEPGGSSSNPEIDYVSDIAVAPDRMTFYTSRTGAGAQTTGGIAVWRDPAPDDFFTHLTRYEAARITSSGNLLAFNQPLPYGITTDAEGGLWVSGSDSTRRWVKRFEINGNVATESAALPSSTTAIEAERDEKGAPFMAPADIALSHDGQTAYVADAGAGVIFVFTHRETTSQEPVKPPVRLSVRVIPNPSRGRTVIETGTSGSPLIAEVYDAMGRRVAVLAETATGQFVWEDDSPPGVYLVRIVQQGLAGKYQATNAVITRIR